MQPVVVDDAFKKQVMAVINEAKAQAETRLAPVLAKFGNKTAAKTKRTAAKKPATVKRVVKRATKRVAKTAGRKAA